MPVAGLKNIFTGKVTLDKVILFHEKESYMRELCGEDKKALYHANAARLLKRIKEQIDGTN